MASHGATEWAQVRTQGFVNLALLTDPSWIRRRVETVRFLDSGRQERRVSLDIDLEALGRLVAGAGGDTGADVWVPLAILSKGLLLDLDVEDQAGVSLSVAPSDVDANASQAAMLAELEIGGVDVGSLSPAVLATVYEAARNLPSDRDLRALTDPLKVVGSIEAWQLVTDLSGSPSDADVFRRLLDDNENFWSWMVNFTAQFQLMTSINPRQGPTIIKYRYIESQVPARPEGLREKMGVAPFFLLVEAPSVGKAMREHIRIEAPEGLFFDNDVYLWELKGALPRDQKAVPAEGRDRYQKRVAPERVAVYTAAADEGSYLIALTMRPRAGGFLRSSSLSVAVTTLLLLAGGILQLALGWLSPAAEGSNVEAAVAILILMPSLTSVYLAREGEHELLSDLLRWPRLAVSATALVALLAGGAMVLHVKGDHLGIVWVVAGALCLGVSGLLGTILFFVRRSFDAVTRTPDVTSEDRVVTISAA